MTDDNIVKFYRPAGATYGDIDPERVLQAAVGKLEHIVILGWDHNGDEYFAASHGSTADNLLLAELFKQRLLQPEE